MLHGIGTFSAAGSGGLGRLIHIPDILGSAERKVDRLEAALDAGKLDPAELAKRLEQRYGEAAAGIVGEDGTVDFDKLQQLIVNTRVQKFEDFLTRRFGDAAEGIIGADGSVDRERLAELVADQRVGRIVDRLEKQYGDGFTGVVAEDGTIDFAALKTLLGLPTTPEAGGPAAVAETEGPSTGPTETLPDETPAAAVEATGTDETPTTVKPSAVDQLAELRNILFQDRIQERFGDAALEKIVGDDGEIDAAALRELFDGGHRGRSSHRYGFGHGNQAGWLSKDRPLFDLRA